jgi:alkylhydroperoxidase family enzyme
MPEPRISPGRRSDVGLINWAIGTVAGKVAGTRPPNLFLTMARHRGLFRGWLFFAGRMMPGGKLPRRETELVILRVAHLAGSDYEFEHHVRLGGKAGVSDAEIERIVRPLGEGEWGERERAILAAVDELHQDHDLSDGNWTALRRYLDERQCIEFLLLVGHYAMLATFLTTLRVAPDRPPNTP